MEDLRNQINTCDLKDAGQIKDIFIQLITKMEHQDDYITHLENENADLRRKSHQADRKMNEMERYSSKNCLIFLGVETNAEEDPLVAVLKVINGALGIQVNAVDIGACHFLPSTGRIKPIIVRFIYDRQRESVWNSRFYLKNLRTPKSRAIFIVERLTDRDRDIMNAAKELNLVTSTFKGRIYVKTDENKWEPMDSVTDVDSVTTSIKTSVKSSNVSTPGVVKKPDLKRFESTSLGGKRKYNDFIAPSSIATQATADGKLDKIIHILELFAIKGVADGNKTGFSPPMKKPTNNDNEANAFGDI